ncbi:cell wall glyco, partial [Fusarium albosuccineum]
MGFTTRATLAGLLVGAAQASPYGYGNGNGTHYTTEVVTAVTTYCPGPTTLTYDDKTYTITEATTLTITDCPCTIAKPAKPTSTGDECAESCYEAYNKCRTGADANMAYCAAKFADCLGYNPFEGGSLVTPTACSKKPEPTGPVYTEVITSLTTYCPGPTTMTYQDKTYTVTEETTLTIPCTVSVPVKPHYTTEVLTAITTYCPEPTTMTYNNKTYTVDKPTTFTITDCPCTVSKPAGPQPSAPSKDCAEMCTDKYNKCRSSPAANQATCAAEYAQCLGYNPFGSNGSFVTPTACHGPAPTGPAPTAPAPTGGAPPTYT